MTKKKQLSASDYKKIDKEVTKYNNPKNWAINNMDKEFKKGYGS